MLHTFSHWHRSHVCPSLLMTEGRLVDCGLTLDSSVNLTVAVLTVNPQWAAIIVTRSDILQIGGSFGGLISTIYTILAIPILVLQVCDQNKPEHDQIGV
jgi:hypothetical protein